LGLLAGLPIEDELFESVACTPQSSKLRTIHNPFCVLGSGNRAFSVAPFIPNMARKLQCLFEAETPFAS
jgi:hypothetical protein